MLGLGSVRRAVWRLHRSLRPAERLILTWMLVLSIGLGIMLWSAQADQRRALKQCADPRGQLALRHQWTRVEQLIEQTRLPKDDPQYLPPAEASKQFAQSYEDALREAGPPPDCLVGDTR